MIKKLFDKIYKNPKHIDNHESILFMTSFVFVIPFAFIVGYSLKYRIIPAEYMTHTFAIIPFVIIGLIGYLYKESLSAISRVSNVDGHDNQSVKRG